MKLELAEHEAVLLGEILAGWLAEVRTEIRHTDRFLWRQELKQEEEIVRQLLVRLPQRSTV